MTLVGEAAQALARHLQRPQVNHILHGFPSVRLWSPAPGAEPEQLRAADQPGPPLDLYVGIPFCVRTAPDRCGYCLFPTEVFERSSQVDAYLELLELDLHRWGSRLAGRPVRSVYVGGGTPNLLRSGHYARLVRAIGAAIELPGRDAITLEGIPQLFGPDRLDAIADAGIGRISMGAQQLDTELAALSGRGQTEEHVVRAVVDARERGLATNVDLIYGWPRQTLATMERDLQRLAALPVDHITHYELNIAGPTAFSLERRDELPDRSEREEMYLRAVAVLRTNGFEQRTMSDFERAERPDDRYVYEEGAPELELREVVGVGQGAITELVDEQAPTGRSWMNHRTLDAYAAALRSDRAPVELGVERTATDLALHVLHRGLQSLRVDDAAHRRLFGWGLDRWDAAWEVLGEEGLVVRTPEGVDLTERGGYHVPTIQAVVADARLRELKDARWTTDRASGAPAGEHPVALRTRS